MVETDRINDKRTDTTNDSGVSTPDEGREYEFSGPGAPAQGEYVFSHKDDNGNFKFNGNPLSRASQQELRLSPDEWAEAQEHDYVNDTGRIRMSMVDTTGSRYAQNYGG